jgi:hypothetical protein
MAASVTPTEADGVSREGQARAIEQANDADDAAHGAGAGLSGNLRISAAVTFARAASFVTPQGPSWSASRDDGGRCARRPQPQPDAGKGIVWPCALGLLSDSSHLARKISESPCVILTPQPTSHASANRDPQDCCNTRPSSTHKGRRLALELHPRRHAIPPGRPWPRARHGGGGCAPPC